MKISSFMPCLRIPERNNGTASTLPPELANFGRNITRFAREMEKHFNGDMNALLQHVTKLPPAEQTAVIDSSAQLRSYIGVRNQNGLRSKPSNIPDHLAPSAFLMVSLRSEKDTRVIRSLTCLQDFLNKHPPGYHADHQYHGQIESLLGSLLKNLHIFRTPVAQEKAVSILEQHFFTMGLETKNDMNRSAQDILNRPEINENTKTRLRKMLESSRKAKFQEILSKPKPSGATQLKAGSTPVTLSQSILINSLSNNKQNFLSLGIHDPVRLSMAEVAILAKDYSERIGNTIHVCGDIIPVPEINREAWLNQGRAYLSSLSSLPDAGILMFKRYLLEFRNDEALGDLKGLDDPMNEDIKDELTTIIDANKNNIFDRLLSRLEKEISELPEQAMNVVHTVEGGVAELEAISNNTGGRAHGYVFPTNNDRVSNGHVENYVVSSAGDIISVIPFPGQNAPAASNYYNSNVDKFMLDGTQLGPQGSIIGCGGMGLSYLKQYLKEDARQLNNNTLLLTGEIDGETIRFHLPSPQVLKYSQSDLYVKSLRAIVAGKNETATVTHKGQKYCMRTLQGMVNNGAQLRRPDGEDIEGGLERFRQQWLDLNDQNDAYRAQMKITDRNLYLSYATQRLKNKVQNIIE